MKPRISIERLNARVKRQTRTAPNDAVNGCPEFLRPLPLRVGAISEASSDAGAPTPRWEEMHFPTPVQGSQQRPSPCPHALLAPSHRHWWLDLLWYLAAW